MKIVQVSAVDSTMNGLLRELNSSILLNGHELICVCSDGDRVENLRKEGFDIRTINIDRNINPIENFKSVIGMYNLFKKETPDIVHVHTPVAAVLGRIAAKLARVPIIIYTAHGFYFHENMTPIKYKLFYTVEKLCARFCTDFIFTQSEEDGVLAIQNKFLPRENITVISNGVDVEEKFNPTSIDVKQIENLRKELNLNEDEILVSFIGRLVKEKGIIDLLNAFSKIEQQNIKLIIIGNTDLSERDQQTFKEIENYRDYSNIIFTGFRRDIPELLSISDIYCLPSYREGMPRSIIEAMAMECAIVATNIRGSREEVDNGENGFLVNLNDPDSLASSIKELANNPEKLSDFKTNAREKAAKLYNEKKVVRTQLDIFETAHSRKEGNL
ncbi:glycosyltransferase family 4 protein [Halobacillus sp. Marseille-Q1614]|uniref:glycosyltransferase family 4 protein n=1 Tax=Halobacillus sp. Marseille-Q1614 TaxID=2709134 RepID=UPI00156F4A59|nr:glycosyltransferase family 4 protein [Halobacillus sp. Marseille-Q1614]